jgi:large subunit ribosomal protein L18
MKTKTFSVQYKRKRVHRTDYKKRVKLISGNYPRVVIRKSLRNIILQLVLYESNGDRIIVDARCTELKKYGWELSSGNICSAYLAGILLGTKAKKEKFEDLVADFGFFPSVKGSRMYAAIKGIIDSGLKVRCGDTVLPDEDRIYGKHIVGYADKLKKESPEKFERQFSLYLKKNVDLNSIPEHVKKVKENIIRGNKNG